MRSVIQESHAADLSIESRNFSYKVVFRNEIKTLLTPTSFVIIDENVYIAKKNELPKTTSLFQFPISESLKNLETCQAVVSRMARNGVSKDFTLFAIGGGATQDIGTLVASLYMRGIKWIYVPTTLMSMMDSCVGGKSSINNDEFKNIIGNFYPPSEIAIDVSLLDLKNTIALASGIAEGLKITYAAGEQMYDDFCTSIDNWRRTKIDDYLTSAILISLRSKKTFIENDEFDTGIRRNLNFGHTFAHALEAATNFQVPHGIAVLIGMRAAILMARSPKPCEVLVNRLNIEMEISGYKGIARLQVNHELFLQALRRDKKNRNNLQVLILPRENGDLSLSAFPMSSEFLEKCAKNLYLALENLGVQFEVL